MIRNETKRTKNDYNDAVELLTDSLIRLGRALGALKGTRYTGDLYFLIARVSSLIDYIEKEENIFDV